MQRKFARACAASETSGPSDSRAPCVRIGRETCLQRVVWSHDGWLRLAQGGWHPAAEVPAPAELPPAAWPAVPSRDDFDGDTLGPHWSSLRTPADRSWLDLRARPGWLRLVGRESVHSLYDQSLVARRLQSFRAVAQTCLEFRPTHFTQAAGLVCWYDTRTHYYLRVTHDDTAGTVLGIVLTDNGAYDELLDSQIAVEGWPQFHLRAEIDGAQLVFSASPDGDHWQQIGPALDATRLSDDYGSALHFTGTLIGICAQDLGGTRAVRAEFDFFELRQDSPE